MQHSTQNIPVYVTKRCYIQCCIDGVCSLTQLNNRQYVAKIVTRSQCHFVYTYVYSIAFPISEGCKIEHVLVLLLLAIMFCT